MYKITVAKLAVEANMAVVGSAAAIAKQYSIEKNQKVVLVKLSNQVMLNN